MKKENVIDLAAYRAERQNQTAEPPSSDTPAATDEFSPELQTAINELIERMRVPDPGK